MKKNIFREYDIRGIYPKDLNEETSYKIGRGFASYIEDKPVIIGYDNRLSSPSLHDSLVKGLLESGANITDLGLCTTPMYYVLKKHLKIKNGIMITASHNPKDYNGFKISFDYYGNACGKQIFDFRDFTINNTFDNKKGTYNIYKDTYEVYLQSVKNSINLGNRKIKAVFDPGNGTSGIIIRKMLDMFDIDYHIINEESDGNFPNHHPDPCEPNNMIQLINSVKELNCDIGIGIDGDADRVGIIDNKGNYISIDKIMIILYEYLLPNMKNKKAIMDVKCSKAVLDEMNRLNVPCEVYRTGNSYMNKKINLDNYDFGGEFSGHIWFNDKWPGIDDGLYASLRIIEMLSKSDEDLYTMLSKLPHYYNTPEIKIEVKEEHKDIIISKVKEYLNNKNIKYNDIDGIRIDYEDGFALIRKSNTGPNLTVRFEKQNEEELNLIKDEYLNLIKKISLELN